MTAREVATYLNCSASTVRRLAAAGDLPHYRLGRLVRFRRNEIEAWLGRQRSGLASPEMHPVDINQLSLFGDDATAR